jgi:hydrogenase maturation protein HypF
VLALGPESSGNFSVYHEGKIYFYQTGMDLIDEKNFTLFKKSVLGFLRKEKIKPDIILTDLHPWYRTMVWGKELARKFKAKNIKVQHHIAHIFSAIGDRIIRNSKFLPGLLRDSKRAGKIRNSIFGVACDGTGYGLDGKIWGGEVFKFQISNFKIRNINRIGHLENQILIGGDLTVQEPARMLISVLSNFLEKGKVFGFVKKYYSHNAFEVIYNQLRDKFNCQETSSTARVLDAVSVLLGFSDNKRGEKHGPVFALEKNSTASYKLDPKIILDQKEKKYILLTTPLFEFLLKNVKKNKRCLAATAQLYLAKGLYGIVKKYAIHNTYFAGGMANNRIMADYFALQGVYSSKKIPRGDAGLSFGQIVYYLHT